MMLAADKISREEQLNSRNLRSFSYSQLSVFSECPYRYRFTYVLKIPRRRKPYFSFGSTMHLTLQKLLERIRAEKAPAQASLFGEEKKARLDWDELLDIYRHSWIDDAYENETERQAYRARGEKILRDFYNKHDGFWPDVRDLEKGFNFIVEGDKNKYCLTGIIDRIDNQADGIKIVDYKTAMDNSSNFFDRRQLYLYQYIAEKAWNDKVVALSFYYLESGREESLPVSTQEAENVLRDFSVMAEKIADNDFTPQASKNKCATCDFRNLCDYRV